MNEIVVTSEGILKLLMGLKTTKAQGTDEIHPRVLKEAAKEVALILSSIF